MIRRLWNVVYRVTLLGVRALSWLIAPLLRRTGVPNSVLHISYMVHVPFHTVQILRRLGMKADYLAVGESEVWDKCDYLYLPNRWPFMRVLQEFWWLWRVLARYEVIHLHFMITLSASGWELAILKRLGRKIVVHYRGCEVRHREQLMARYPESNICQACDYNATICRSPLNRHRRMLADRHGDLFLVTTPDMLEFVPKASVFPFFTPELPAPTPPEPAPPEARPGEKRFKIVHATNHPGIEGTEMIEAAIRSLQEAGHPVDFVFLKGVSHERVLDEFRDADLAIGKMKMGHYANAQIESMVLGVPTVTSVRPEYRTAELEQSGFILTDLSELRATLEHLLTHPDALAAKRRIARKSIMALHPNDALGRRLIALYNGLDAGPSGK